ARFVAVAGASGSGKSSLVRAGLVPKLTRRADWRVLPPIVPGGRPLDALARALVVGPPTGSDGAPALAERLDAGGAPELLAVVDELLAAREEETNAALLVVDQFEQLVTQGSEEQTSRFLDLLRGALAAQGSPLRAVVTVRSEYVNEALRLAAVEERAETYLVTSLDRHQLRDVI
ncbi:MAG: WD40 repeat domain-containing protein, partial [Gammaproteobacteria bacterium]|nr:WD40 repeat domain-containing protein [Gemmatimonadota bacterium]NIU79974.1 WD40 repeat domain-containing protein [Gammaproteobacteria bacterium]